MWIIPFQTAENLMIIVKLAGGLGNQMFQYAAGIALAERLCCECKFDLDWFSSNNIHNGFELNRVFNLDLPVATLKDKKQVFGMYEVLIKFLGNRFFSRKISFLQPKFLLTEDKYESFLDPNLLNCNLYMVGYWQSEYYFFKKNSKIKRDFTIKFPINDLTQNWINLISEQSSSVSIHIRRGDYVSDEKSFIAMGVCSLSYYKEAIALMIRQIDNPVFFVFSDDLNWAKEQFGFIQNAYFIEGNSGSDSCLDMHLMSLCSNHILANSSFSWWGAWLAHNENQVVIAPFPWFNSIQLSRHPITLKNWIVLDKISGALLK